LGYIGKQPAKVPLTSSDITDNIITSAKIANGAITGDDISSTFNISSKTVTLPSASVTAHATDFDDNKIVNDLSTLGLRVHSQENLTASNSNSASFEVLQDSSKIENLTNVSRHADEYVASVIALDGSYETGDRTSSYGTIDATVSMGAGSNSNMIDGGTTMNNSDSVQFSTEAASGLKIWIDLGSGNSKIWTGAKWTHEANSLTHGTWKYQGSNNNTDWTDLSSNFILNNNTTTTETTWSNTTAYRYIRMLGVSGNIAGSPWMQEWELRVGSLTASATGSFEGTAITASASTSSMGAVITYQDHAGTNALNTDIILKLSADNGSNYSTATLTALPNFATGIKMAKVNDLSVTAGTQLKYKIEFANQSAGSKEARIRGVSLQY